MEADTETNLARCPQPYLQPTVLALDGDAHRL